MAENDIGRKKKKKEKRDIESKIKREEEKKRNKTELEKEAEVKNGMGAMMFEEHDSMAFRTGRIPKLPKSFTKAFEDKYLKVEANENERQDFEKLKRLSYSIIAILAVTTAVFLCLYINKTRNYKEAKRVVTLLNTSVNKYKDKQEELKASISEKDDTITILSDSLATTETALEEAQTQLRKLYIPSGYPIKGKALMKEERADHYGVIFASQPDTFVVAAGTGVIENIEVDETYGNIITVDHGNDYKSIYKAQGIVYVTIGDTVSAGTVLIATGEAESDMEYDIKFEDKYIDPLTCMEING